MTGSVLRSGPVYAWTEPTMSGTTTTRAFLALLGAVLGAAALTTSDDCVDSQP